MPEFWFIRHGEATHNTDAIARGDTAYFDPIHKDAELTENGKTQVRAAARNLPNDRPFAAVYCSPLRRCRQTLLGAAPGCGPVTLDDRLMEPQGAHPCNRRIEREALANAVSAEWSLGGVAEKNPYDAPYESRTAFAARVRDVAAAIAARHATDDRVLVVTHHDWVQTWFREHLGISVSLRNAEVVRAVWQPAKA